MALPARVKTEHSLRPRLKLGGFTLIEMTVALVVVGLTFAIAAPAAQKMYQTMQYHDAVRALSTAVAKARRQASVAGRPVDLVIDADQRDWTVAPAGTSLQSMAFASLPDTLALTVRSAAEVSPGNGVAAIRFYPSGGCTGGDIAIERESGGGVVLKVDWLLADVEQLPLEAF
jgi:prepilin-type N-terminal cleavage/methylation domain-containing protein